MVLCASEAKREAGSNPALCPQLYAGSLRLNMPLVSQGDAGKVRRMVTIGKSGNLPSRRSSGAGFSHLGQGIFPFRNDSKAPVSGAWVRASVWPQAGLSCRLPRAVRSLRGV
jgi:hypothetical protein